MKLLVELFRIGRIFFLLGGFSLAVGCSSLPAQRPMVCLEEAHHFASTQIEFNPDGRQLASGGLGGDIKIWSFPDMIPVMTLKVHKKAIRGLVWLNSNLLVSGGDDGRVVIWDLARKTPRQIRVALFSSPIKGLALLRESRELVSGHKDGTIRVLELSSLLTLREKNLGSRVLALRSQPGGAVLAVSTVGKKVLLLDRKLQVAQELTQPPREIYSLAFSPDRRELAGGGWFKLFLWELSDGSLVARETSHLGKIPSLDYSPNGDEIASIGRITGSRIFLTRRATGKPIRHLLRHSLCGTALRFSPDGRYVASTSDDKSIRIYDLAEPYPPR